MGVVGVWLLDAGPHVARAGGPKSGTRFTRFRILEARRDTAGRWCIWLHVSGFELLGKLFVRRETWETTLCGTHSSLGAVGKIALKEVLDVHLLTGFALDPAHRVFQGLKMLEKKVVRESSV